MSSHTAGLRLSLLKSAALAAVLATPFAPARAQNAAPEGDPSPNDATAPAEEGGLETIIVTARKRDENVQNIPVAVTALASEELVNRNIRTIEQVAASVPQFVVARGSTGSGANLSLRGIGSNFTSIGIEQSVSVNVDGVYYGQGRVLNEGLYDMAQVEILKGPQALFFGKNSTAGALSFTTANPTNEFEALGRVGYEFKTQEKYAEAVLSGPISDTLSARLALRATDMDQGYVLNQAGAGTFRVTDAVGGVSTLYNVPASERYGPMERTLGGRLTLEWEPSNEVTVRLKGSFADRKGGTPGFNNELFRCPINNTSQLQPGNECVPNWRGYWADLPQQLVAANPLLGKKDGELYDDYRSYTSTFSVGYNPDNFAINWVNGYQNFRTQFALKSDVTENANRGTYAGTLTQYEAFSSELRAQSDLESPLNALLGLYLQKSQLDFQQDIIFPGSAAAGHAINSAAPSPDLVPLTVRKLGDTDGFTFAPFGQLLWDITPELQATAGGRYSYEVKKSNYTQPYVIPAFRAVFRMFNPADPRTFFNTRQKFSEFSPEATLRWKPTPDLTLYAAYKTGYKSGGFSISALNSASTQLSDLDFEPETVHGFEAGVRSVLADNQLRLNATAFRYDYDDLQVDFFNSAITTFVTFNAGTARTQGLEIDTEFAPRGVPGLTLRGSLAFLDAKYVDFPGAPCYAGQTPAMGCMPATAAIPYIHQDLKGVRTQLAPKFAGSLSADYDTELNSSFKMGLTANLRYSDDYLLSPFGNRVDRQSSYALLDASARFGSVDDRWQLAVIGKNLTNRYVLTSAQDAPSTGAGTGTAAGIPADQFGFPAPPRTVAVQLTVRY